VDDHVLGVDEHPVGRSQPLSADAVSQLLLALGLDPLCERCDLPRRPPGRDDHIVGDGAFSGQRNLDDILGLAVFKAFLDQGAQRLDIRVNVGQSIVPVI